jgi:hypothetical protein
MPCEATANGSDGTDMQKCRMTFTENGGLWLVDAQQGHEPVDVIQILLSISLYCRQ